MNDETKKDFLEEAEKEKKELEESYKESKRQTKERGGIQQECKVIQRRADQWCKDNGYPVQRRKYWQKRKWTPTN
jgi:hypothetical protein